MSFKINDIVEVEVSEISYQGLGVSRQRGYSIFVQGLFIGEKGLVRITKINSKIVFGIVEQLITTDNTNRLFFDNSAILKTGIVPFWGLTYNYQVWFKDWYLRKLVAWNLKLSEDVVKKLVPNDSETGNRNKISIPLVFEDNKLWKAGYIFQTRKKVILEKHPLIKPKTEEIINEIIGTINHFYKINNKEEDLKNIIKLTCRIGKKGKMIFILSIVNQHYFDSYEIINFIKSKNEIVQFWLENIRKQNSYLKNIFTKQDFMQEIGGLNFRLQPKSFFQTDIDGFYKIIEVAKHFFEKWNLDKLIEFHCGVGSLGMLISNKDTKITGIDIVPEAIQDAKYNAKKNKYKNTKYFTGDAFAIIKKQHISFSETIILLDPPRAGLDLDFVNYLIEKEAKRIIYISCDPRTLIRDLKIFKDNNYKIRFIQGFDLFPQTAHIETITIVEK